MNKLYLNYLLRLSIFVVLIVYFFWSKSNGDNFLPFALIIVIGLAGLYSLFRIDRKKILEQNYEEEKDNI